jgi:hypothetical protein
LQSANARNYASMKSRRSARRRSCSGSSSRLAAKRG